MIYKNEKRCKQEKLSDIERMEYHKEKSKEYFECIKAIFLIVMGKIEREDEMALRKKFKIPLKKYIAKYWHFKKFFTIEDKLNVKGSQRIIYHMQKIPLEN